MLRENSNQNKHLQTRSNSIKLKSGFQEMVINFWWLVKMGFRVYIITFLVCITDEKMLIFTNKTV